MRRLLVLVIVLAGCGGSATMGGIWRYQSYTSEEVTHQVEAGVNAVAVPWIEVTADDITGNAGCNDFAGPYELTDENLASDLVKNAAWCGPDDGSPMNAELA